MKKLLILFLLAFKGVKAQVYFAKLDSSNMVMSVVSVDSKNAPSEAAGNAYLRKIHGHKTIWVQTYYNDEQRKNYAGIGYKYDTIKNCFIPPRPTIGSYTLNPNTCKWDTVRGN